MPDDRLIADTCVWIEYFRQRGPVSSALRNLIKQGRVAVAGPIIYELLQGAKSRKDADLIKEVTKALPLLTVTQETWLSAGDLFFELRRKGITLPPSDVLLAILAIQNEYPVFTLDNHFDRIPKVRRFPLP
jgi:predicted nucleic acid-binding protein